MGVFKHICRTKKLAGAADAKTVYIMINRKKTSIMKNGSVVQLDRISDFGNGVVFESAKSLGHFIILLEILSRFFSRNY